MKPRDFKKIFILFLLGFISASLANLPSDTAKKVKARSLVYFPSLPDPFSEDFGVRVSSRKAGSSERSKAPKDLVPVSSPKPTTTTEKLPLAQESHVVNNSITEAPQPAYLTDTLYYDSGPTPAPGSKKNEFFSPDRDLVEDRESEKDLQSVLSYEPQFAGDKLAVDPLVNPAIFYYIPEDSEDLVDLIDSVDSVSLEDSSPSPPINDPGIVNQIPVDYSTPSPPADEPRVVITSTYERPDVSTSAYRRPVAQVTTYERPVVPPTEARTKAPPTRLPSRPTDSPKLFRPSPTPSPGRRYLVRTQRPPKISRPPQKSSKILIPKRVDKTNSLRVDKSRGYARRGGSANSVSKVSSQDVKPLYDTSEAHGRPPSPTHVRPPTSNYAQPPLPANVRSPTPTRIRLPTSVQAHLPTSAHVRPPTSAYAQPPPSALIQSPLFANPPHSQSFTRSKPTRMKIKKQKISTGSYDSTTEGPSRQRQIVEIYRPPGQEDSEEFFEQNERDYSFDFDNASGSAPERHYRPTSVTTTPFEEAPIYRTSTTAYRPPSTLYHVRRKEEKEVTDPSRRDFVQADSNIYVPQEYSEETIPGVRGIDYPIYVQVPDTEFSCSDQDHPGLYADTEAGCQVFHICQKGGREDSFVCPIGTVFNQQYFVCDWWYNFSCDQADRFYSLNAFLYEVPEDRTRGRTSYS